jgi:SET domain-containing protein
LQQQQQHQQHHHQQQQQQKQQQWKIPESPRAPVKDLPEKNGSDSAAKSSPSSSSSSSSSSSRSSSSSTLLPSTQYPAHFSLGSLIQVLIAFWQIFEHGSKAD